MSETIAQAALLAVLGAIVGSFVATIVIRWPQGRSAMRGRSACDACGRTLGARDLVPLLSAALSRRRCRTCGARIDPRHWRIEALAAFVGLAAGLAAPLPEALAGAVFGWLLLTAAALDADEFWIPDEVTAAIAGAGLLSGVLFAPAMTERLIGGAGGFAALWLVGFGYRHLRGREGLGGADPKLLGAIGLWLGWRMLPQVLLLAALVGLSVALFAVLRGRDVARDTALPFGTFLAIAAYPAWIVMVTLRA